MIDLHTHIWNESHWSEDTQEALRRAYSKNELVKQLNISNEQHWKESGSKVDKSCVYAMMMTAAGIVVPNDYIYSYVRTHPETLIGVASVDPNEADCTQELERAVKTLGFQAVKLSGAYQNFNPADPKHDPLYQTAQDLGIPIFWHAATTPWAGTPLKWSGPILIDEVAQRFPKLPMQICHMGHPWHDDAVMVVRKHPNVYTDISGIGPRKWKFYEALRTAHEYDVGHKLLFGSDYPFTTVDSTIEDLKNTALMAKNIGLPEIPQTLIEDLLERDSMKLLGMT